MALSGWLRWLVPARYNELFGLQHMKVYVFDDTVLISGYDAFTYARFLEIVYVFCLCRTFDAGSGVFVECCKPLAT